MHGHEVLIIISGEGFNVGEFVVWCDEGGVGTFHFYFLRVSGHDYVYVH